MHKAVSRTLVGKKRKPARDDCERYRGYFSGHGSLALRFQGSLRKSHCKDEASQVGWITYLVDLLRYYYWLPGTQITFRDCRSSFVLFPTTFLEKAHDKHWYCNKEGGRNKNYVPKLFFQIVRVPFVIKKHVNTIRRVEKTSNYTKFLHFRPRSNKETVLI